MTFKLDDAQCPHCHKPVGAEFITHLFTWWLLSPTMTERLEPVGRALKEIGFLDANKVPS